MRHGFGYSVSRHASAGLEQEVTLVRADRRAGQGHARARDQHRHARPPPLVLVLPAARARGAARGQRPLRGDRARRRPARALLARNPMAGEFAARVAFAAAVTTAPAARAQRRPPTATAFLGPGGSPARRARSPRAGRSTAARRRARSRASPQQVDARARAGRDGRVRVPARRSADAGGGARARRRLRAAGRDRRGAGRRRRAFWSELVSGVHIETPAPALDLMVNGWLAYQTLALPHLGTHGVLPVGRRVRLPRPAAGRRVAAARCGPELTRAQILLHAAHQFVEGDVLHWWHPPLGQGHAHALRRRPAVAAAA